MKHPLFAGCTLQGVSVAMRARYGGTCSHCGETFEPGTTIIAVKWSSRYNEYVIDGHLGDRLRRWRLRNNPLARRGEEAIMKR